MNDKAVYRTAPASPGLLMIAWMKCSGWWYPGWSVRYHDRQGKVSVILIGRGKYQWPWQEGPRVSDDDIQDQCGDCQSRCTMQLATFCPWSYHKLKLLYTAYRSALQANPQYISTTISSNLWPQKQVYTRKCHNKSDFRPKTFSSCLPQALGLGPLKVPVSALKEKCL